METHHRLISEKPTPVWAMTQSCSLHCLQAIAGWRIRDVFMLTWPWGGSGLVNLSSGTSWGVWVAYSLGLKEPLSRVACFGSGKIIIQHLYSSKASMSEWKNRRECPKLFPAQEKYCNYLHKTCTRLSPSAFHHIEGRDPWGLTPLFYLWMPISISPVVAGGGRDTSFSGVATGKFPLFCK